MVSALSDRWWLVLSLGLAACGSERVSIVPPPPMPTSVTVTPSAVSLMCGQTVRLIAAVAPDNPQVNRAVQWMSSNDHVAHVDSTGLVLGYGLGTAWILARSVADQNVAAVAAVTVAGITLPVITVSAVAEAATAQPANLNAITDSIDVTFNLNDPGCLGGALPWVSLTASITNGQDSLTTAVPVPNSAASQIQLKVRLNTAAKKADGTPVLHDGSYTLTGLLLGSDGTKIRAPNVTVTVAN